MARKHVLDTPRSKVRVQLEVVCARDPEHGVHPMPREAEHGELAARSAPRSTLGGSFCRDLVQHRRTVSTSAIQLNPRRRHAHRHTACRAPAVDSSTMLRFVSTTSPARLEGAELAAWRGYLQSHASIVRAPDA